MVLAAARSAAGEMRFTRNDSGLATGRLGITEQTDAVVIVVSRKTAR